MNDVTRVQYRELPHNLEVEYTLLGTLMASNRMFDQIAGLLDACDFYEPVHQEIYERIGTLIHSNMVANPVTIRAGMKDRKVGELTLTEYLARVAGAADHPAQAKQYAEIVSQMSVRREAISRLMSAIDALHAPQISGRVLEEIEPVEDWVMSIRAEKQPLEQQHRIGKRYTDSLGNAGRSGNVEGVPVCLPEIARVISEDSFEPGNLYGLLSSSGEGKTSLTIQIMKHALDRGHPVLFLSYDQSAEQVCRQMAAQTFKIEARRQRAGSLSEKEWDTAAGFGNWLDHQPFEVQRCTDQGAAQLLSMARAFVKRFSNGKPPLVVVDHIGAVTPEDRRADPGSKAREINKVFKAGAEATKAAWLVLNQRNSEGMKRENPRPIGSDLYGGDPAKQAYDALFYVYRFKKYLEERKAIAAKPADWAAIERIVPQAVRLDDMDIAEIGAIKVRFGNVNVRQQLIFEDTFTRYRSEGQPEHEHIQQDMGFA